MDTGTDGKGTVYNITVGIQVHKVKGLYYITVRIQVLTVKGMYTI